MWPFLFHFTFPFFNHKPAGRRMGEWTRKRKSEWEGVRKRAADMPRGGCYGRHAKMGVDQKFTWLTIFLLFISFVIRPFLNLSSFYITIFLFLSGIGHIYYSLMSSFRLKLPLNSDRKKWSCRRTGCICKSPRLSSLSSLSFSYSSQSLLQLGR